MFYCVAQSSDHLAALYVSSLEHGMIILLVSAVPSSNDRENQTVCLTKYSAEPNPEPVLIN